MSFHFSTWRSRTFLAAVAVVAISILKVAEIRAADPQESSPGVANGAGLPARREENEKYRSLQKIVEEMVHTEQGEVAIMDPDGKNILKDPAAGADIVESTCSGSLNGKDTVYKAHMQALGDAAQNRSVSVELKWAKTFLSKPVVIVSIVKIDLNGTKTEFGCSAKDVSKEGCTLVFQTYTDSHIFGATVSFTAFAR